MTYTIPRLLAADDPTLPCYESPDYKDQKAGWELCDDIWQGRSAWYHPVKSIVDLAKANRYLPMELKEPRAAYTSRLARSPFKNKFRRAIGAFVGLLSNLDLGDDIHPSIEDYQDDVDLCGNDLITFLSKLDEKALALGHCFVLVDYPRPPQDESGQPLELNALLEQQLERRPHFVAIDPRDVLNWRIRYEQGRPLIEQVTIRSAESIPQDRFGSETRTTYRVLSPGRYELYEQTDPDDERAIALVKEGTTSLDFVPLVFYSATDTEIMVSVPPLLNLAELNIRLYQSESDYYEIQRKLNLPTPVRKGLILSGQDPSEAPQLELGPNSFIDLPTEGDFYWAEPTGGAIAATRQSIQDIKMDMESTTLAFITTDSDKTATEVKFSAAQTQASLTGMARLKKNAVELMLSFWSSYYGTDEGGTVQIDADILQDELTPEDRRFTLDSFLSGAISQELFLKVMREGINAWKAINPDEEENASERGQMDADEERVLDSEGVADVGENNRPK